MSPSQVAYVAEQMLDMGCHEVSLGDTIGVGTPDKGVSSISLSYDYAIGNHAGIGSKPFTLTCTYILVPLNCLETLGMELIPSPLVSLQQRKLHKLKR